MKAIIFGVNGQDGSYLAELLLDKGYSVVGVTRRASTDNTSRLSACKANNNFKIINGDITDAHSIIDILSKNPDTDEIYNLAAQSHVYVSFKQPGLTWDITGKGCLNILQSMVDLEMYSTRFYQASSSEMFGASYDVDKYGNKYQDENTKFLPQSPYAIAKCAAHYITRLFRESHGLHASSGILFNHEGPRRGDNFVTKKITKWIGEFIRWKNNQVSYSTDIYPDKIVAINNSTFPKLRLGNLDAFRDWGYAKEYVEAMWLMLQQEDPDDYVICTEETRTIRDFLNVAFNSIGIENWYENYVIIDPEFCRPAEVNYLCGKNTKAKTKLGWSPKTSFEDLVKLMVDFELNENI
jgi:GDPmannose 4,6-dehydratase